MIFAPAMYISRRTRRVLSIILDGWLEERKASNPSDRTGAA